jgi:transposase-like protein
MGKRTELSVADRTEAVLALLRREEPAAKISRRFGISEQTLYRYREQFLDGGKAALANGRRGKADPRDAELERMKKDISRRDRVIGELTIANDVLKKTSDGSL